ncbi:MAG: hypothetical protein HRU07_09880 [Nitrosopumilus sp.]|nr:hypothetical protein [Nitrosopumilus sp.]NRA06436.1 hypothetical protein [Nitrosopumilus sp.]
MTGVEDAEKLAALFRSIGKPISMDMFDDKLEVQKIVYLAQTYGINLEYPFEWYIRGPYCKQVSERAHQILDNNITPTDFAGLDEVRVAKFGQILQPYINNTEWLEIAGSLVYLRKENYAGMPLEEIIGYLIEDLSFGYKNFDESLVRQVIVEMLRINLIN